MREISFEMAKYGGLLPPRPAAYYGSFPFESALGRFERERAQEIAYRNWLENTKEKVKFVTLNGEKLKIVL